MRERKIDGMLLATFLTTLFYSSTYPYIHKIVMENVSETVIAINQIINCVSVIFFGFAWNRMSEKLFKYYPLFCITETIIGIAVASFVSLTENILLYYIADTLLFAIVTRNICCGGIKLRAIRYETEKKRETFDNNNNSASAIATILGSFVAIALKLDFISMLWIATIGNSIDNLFYMAIYYKTRR